MSTRENYGNLSLFDAHHIPTDSSGVPLGLLDSGITYVPNFIAARESNNLLSRIDAKPWSHDLKRRVQHYGWRYDYSSRFVSEQMKTEPLPDFVAALAHKLHERGWFDSIPDQVIVNEYEPGQGIAPHIDRDCFGPTVATLSLGDRWPMQFIPTDTTNATTNVEEVFLDVGSVLVLQKDARTKWLHGIAKRRSDGQRSNRRPRRRRVSVTFRTVELQPRWPRDQHSSASGRNDDTTPA